MRENQEPKREPDYIHGGYILLARKLLNSEVMEKPSLVLKLWVWMLLEASHKEHRRLKRGEFFTSLARIQKAMAYKIGYRLVMPTIKEIRTATKILTKSLMIGTTKGTHGMLITIRNYDFYQNPKNYEGHNEGHSEGHTKGTIKTRMVNKNGLFVQGSIELELSSFLLIEIRKNKPDFKEPNFQSWAKDFDLMIRRDKREPGRIKEVISWVQADSFWFKNILSPGKLRKQFDRVEMEMNGKGKISPLKSDPPRNVTAQWREMEAGEPIPCPAEIKPDFLKEKKI